MNNKTISILGCGWFGMAMAKKLVALGFNVKGSTTSANKLEILKNEGISPYLLTFEKDKITKDSDFFSTDILFICIPPKRNSTEFSAYPHKIKTIIEQAKNQAKEIVFISSTSVYGDVNQEVDENTIPIPDTEAGKLILETEGLVLKESNSTIIRFAGLFGPERNPGNFFKGKKDIPNGLAPVNLIHQNDAAGIALDLIQKQAFGRIYNACSPQHPSRTDFYTTATEKSGLEKPFFKAEKNSWKIITSVNVPKFLDYKFQEIL